MTYIGEEFQKRFKTLPEDVQNALTAVASVDTIFAIGKKHGLMVDQIGKMADEIWKVMLGLANPKDFIRNLASSLGIESEKASAIASEVNAQMFQLVRESLRRLYDSSIPSAIAPPSPPYIKGGDEEEEDNKIPPLKLRGVRGVTEKGEGEIISPMIYPHDRFEEEFMKPDQEKVAGSMQQVAKEDEKQKETPASQQLQRGEPEQLAPLVPSVVEGPSPPAITPSKGEEELLYPKKTEEVSREMTKGREYQGKDPYREAVE